MPNRKLLRYLSSFSSEDWKHCRDFLDSPYFNGNDRLLPLFAWLATFRDRWQDAELTPEAAFAVLKPEPGAVYRRELVSSYCFKLNRLLEQYFTHQRVREHPDTAGQLLRYELYHRDLYTDFAKLSETHCTQLTEATQRGGDWHHHYYSAVNQYYHHPLADQPELNERLLAPLDAELDRHYAHTRLRYELDRLQYIRAYQANRQWKISDTSVRLLRQFVTTEDPLLRPMVELLQLARRAPEDPPVVPLFGTLLARFSTIALPLAPLERELYGHFMNETLHLERQGILSFHPSVVDMYKVGLQIRAFVYRNQMPPEFFLNIISSVVRTDAAVAQRVFDDYHASVPEITRVSASAYLKFYQRDYYGAIVQLERINPRDFRTVVRLRALAIRCWYRIYRDKPHNQYVLRNKIKAFKQYLQKQRRKQQYVFTTESYGHFLDCVTAMIGTPLDELKDLHSEFETLSPLALREWLVDQLFEVET